MVESEFPVAPNKKRGQIDPVDVYAYLVCEELKERGLVSRRHVKYGENDIGGIYFYTMYFYTPTETGKPKLQEFVNEKSHEFVREQLDRFVKEKSSK